MNEDKGWWNENPAPAPPPAQEAVTVNEFKGLPVRAGGDRIWLLKGGEKRWISTSDVYMALGFKFGDEKEIDEATLDVIPEGEPIK